MSEMVERVARTLCTFAGDCPDDIVRGDVLLWTRYEGEARVAIAAMRQPTEAMINLGWQLIRGNLRPDEIYPHMIDEALKPKTTN